MEITASGTTVLNISGKIILESLSLLEKVTENLEVIAYFPLRSMNEEGREVP